MLASHSRLPRQTTDKVYSFELVYPFIAIGPLYFVCLYSYTNTVLYLVYTKSGQTVLYLVYTKLVYTKLLTLLWVTYLYLVYTNTNTVTKFIVYTKFHSPLLLLPICIWFINTLFFMFFS